MEIGDIVITASNPPHIASITDGGQIICEDGTILHLEHTKVMPLYSALEVIQSLEKEVLRRHASG